MTQTPFATTEGREESSHETAQNLEYEEEVRPESSAEERGSSQRRSYPDSINNSNRRFVLEYPYVEKVNSVTKQEEQEDEMKLIPVKAPPELVLRAAMESVIDEANNPTKQSDIDRNELRTGEYWNSYWKEEVDPESLLRTAQRPEVQKSYNTIPKLASMQAEIMPGSQIYQLISVLRKISPKLLYIINSEE